MVKMYQYVSDNITGALNRLAQQNLSIKNSRLLAKFVKKQNEEHVFAVTAYQTYQKKKEQGLEDAESGWAEFLNQDLEVEKLPADILDQVEKMSAADIILLEPLMEEKK